MLSKLHSILAILLIQFSLSGAVNADCDPTIDIFCKLLDSEFSIAETSNNASTSKFCNGFKAGFKAEFNRESGGNVEPFYSQCPLQPPKGKGLKSDYEYGYTFGVKQYNFESGWGGGSRSYSKPVQFCEGFRDGYKSEFNRESGGNIEPFYSQCPQPFSGKEGYEDGYIFGTLQVKGLTRNIFR